MADDERRAEIEAVARRLRPYDWSPAGLEIDRDRTRKHAAELIAALDRVRDARGDDEPQAGPGWVCACGWANRNRPRCGQCGAARSSQDEDHEAAGRVRDARGDEEAACRRCGSTTKRSDCSGSAWGSPCDMQVPWYPRGPRKGEDHERDITLNNGEPGDARGDDEAALGSMWTIMQTQFERGRIPECHGPTRNDARKMLAGFRRVAARDARGDETCRRCGSTTRLAHCDLSAYGGPCDMQAARSPQGEDHEA